MSSHSQQGVFADLDPITFMNIVRKFRKDINRQFCFSHRDLLEFLLIKALLTPINLLTEVNGAYETRVTQATQRTATEIKISWGAFDNTLKISLVKIRFKNRKVLKEHKMVFDLKNIKKNYEDKLSLL